MLVTARYVVTVAAASTARTAAHVLHRRLWWRGDRIGARLRAPDGGTYVVFRDTGRRDPAGGVTAPADRRATYVAGFRFAWLGPCSSWRHRLFRRVCVVTVPLFSGCDGYRRKLWLAEEGGSRYLGVYEWDDAATATAYDGALRPLLRLLGAPGSVHGTVIADLPLDAYLAARAIDGPVRAAPPPDTPHRAVTPTG